MHLPIDKENYLSWFVIKVILIDIINKLEDFKHMDNFKLSLKEQSQNYFYVTKKENHRKMIIVLVNYSLNFMLYIIFHKSNLNC